MTKTEIKQFVKEEVRRQLTARFKGAAKLLNVLRSEMDDEPVVKKINFPPGWGKVNGKEF